MAALTLPTVHLNGTSRQALLDAYGDAMTAVYEAMRRVEASAPNARDYYPQGDDAFPIARREHASRVDALNGVLRDLEFIFNALHG